MIGRCGAASPAAESAGDIRIAERSDASNGVSNATACLAGNTDHEFNLVAGTRRETRKLRSIFDDSSI